MQAQNSLISDDWKHSPDHFLWTARDAGTQTGVGTLWFAVQEQGGQQIAYVYDIHIRPQHRRKGYATQLFAFLENEVRERGLSGIGLHVFGHNKAAQAVYTKIGFQPTNINMFKKIGPKEKDSD